MAHHMLKRHTQTHMKIACLSENKLGPILLDRKHVGKNCTVFFFGWTV